MRTAMGLCKRTLLRGCFHCREAPPMDMSEEARPPCGEQLIPVAG